MLSKCNPLILSALFVVAAVTLTNAADTGFDLQILNNTLNIYAKQRSLVLCMVNSCDPLALLKLGKIVDSFEDMMNVDLELGESHEMESLRLVMAGEHANEMILAMEPKCIDPSYVCPYPVNVHIPGYIYEYINVVGDMLDASKCITASHVAQVIDILGKCAQFLEQYKQHMTNFIQIALPAPKYVAKEFRKLCLRA